MTDDDTISTSMLNSVSDFGESTFNTTDQKLKNAISQENFKFREAPGKTEAQAENLARKFDNTFSENVRLNDLKVNST